MWPLPSAYIAVVWPSFCRFSCIFMMKKIDPSTIDSYETPALISLGQYEYMESIIQTEYVQFVVNDLIIWIR